MRASSSSSASSATRARRTHTCGRERTAAAFEDLLAAAGFVTRNINPLDGDALVTIESKEDK